MRPGPGRTLLMLYVTGVYVFLFVPILVAVLFSFMRDITVLDFRHATLRWYQALWQDPTVVGSLVFSIQIGLICAVLSCIIGGLASFALVRHTFRAKPLLQAALFSPMIFPEIITAVALLSFFSLLRMPRGYLTLIIGHTLLVLPYVISVTSARLYGFNRSVEEAALNLGATPLQTLREVTAPLIAPALVGAAFVAFKVSFDNVVGSLFWSPLGRQPLPVVLFAMLQFELTPMVNAIGTVITTVSLMAIGVFQLSQLSRSSRPAAA